MFHKISLFGGFVRSDGGARKKKEPPTGGS